MALSSPTSLIEEVHKTVCDEKNNEFRVALNWQEHTCHTLTYFYLNNAITNMEKELGSSRPFAAYIYLVYQRTIVNTAQYRKSNAKGNLEKLSKFCYSAGNDSSTDSGKWHQYTPEVRYSLKIGPSSGIEWYQPKPT